MINKHDFIKYNDILKNIESSKSKENNKEYEEKKINTLTIFLSYAIIFIFSVIFSNDLILMDVLNKPQNLSIFTIVFNPLSLCFIYLFFSIFFDHLFYKINLKKIISIISIKNIKSNFLMIIGFFSFCVFLSVTLSGFFTHMFYLFSQNSNLSNNECFLLLLFFSLLLASFFKIIYLEKSNITVKYHLEKEYCYKNNQKYKAITEYIDKNINDINDLNYFDYIVNSYRLDYLKESLEQNTNRILKSSKYKNLEEFKEEIFETNFYSAKNKKINIINK